jgi:hypothetical protein
MRDGVRTEQPHPGLLSEESAKEESAEIGAMIALIWLLPAVLPSPFKSAFSF